MLCLPLPRLFADSVSLTLARNADAPDAVPSDTQRKQETHNPQRTVEAPNQDRQLSGDSQTTTVVGESSEAATGQEVLVAQRGANPVSGGGASTGPSHVSALPGAGIRSANSDAATQSDGIPTENNSTNNDISPHDHTRIRSNSRSSSSSNNREGNRSRSRSRSSIGSRNSRSSSRSSDSHSHMISSSNTDSPSITSTTDTTLPGVSITPSRVSTMGSHFRSNDSTLAHSQHIDAIPDQNGENHRISGVVDSSPSFEAEINSQQVLKLQNDLQYLRDHLLSTERETEQIVLQLKVFNILFCVSFLLFTLGRIKSRPSRNNLKLSERSMQRV